MHARSTLVQIVLLVAVFGTMPGRAQSALGKIVEKGVEMPVKSAVGIWDPKRPALTILLLPFDPTPEQIAAFQKDDYTMLLLDTKSPDPKKWPNNTPYGSLTLGWPFDKDKIGDTATATIALYSYNITPGSNVNMNAFGSDPHGKLTLSGTAKEGQEVTVTYKGEHNISGPYSWDLTLKVKLLPRIPK
jgi:hypothetical protein